MSHPNSADSMAAGQSALPKGNAGARPGGPDDAQKLLTIRVLPPFGGDIVAVEVDSASGDFEKLTVGGFVAEFIAAYQLLSAKNPRFPRHENLADEYDWPKASFFYMSNTVEADHDVPEELLQHGPLEKLLVEQVKLKQDVSTDVVEIPLPGASKDVAPEVPAGKAGAASAKPQPLPISKITVCRLNPSQLLSFYTTNTETHRPVTLHKLSQYAVNGIYIHAAKKDESVPSEGDGAASPKKPKLTTPASIIKEFFRANQTGPLQVLGIQQQDALALVPQEAALESLFALLQPRVGNTSSDKTANPHVILRAAAGFGKSFNVQLIARKAKHVLEAARHADDEWRATNPSAVEAAKAKFQAAEAALENAGPEQLENLRDKRTNAENLLREVSIDRQIAGIYESCTTIPITYNFIMSRGSVPIAHEETDLCIRLLFSYCFGEMAEDVSRTAFTSFSTSLDHLKLDFIECIKAIHAHLEERGNLPSIFLMVDEISKAGDAKVQANIMSTLGKGLESFPDARKFMLLYTSLDFLTFQTESLLSKRPLRWCQRLQPIIAPVWSDTSDTSSISLKRDAEAILKISLSEDDLVIVADCGGHPRSLAILKSILSKNPQASTSRKWEDFLRDMYNKSIPVQPEELFHLLYALLFVRTGGAKPSARVPNIVQSLPRWMDAGLVFDIPATQAAGAASDVRCPFLPMAILTQMAKETLGIHGLDLGDLTAPGKGTAFEVFLAKMIQLKAIVSLGAAAPWTLHGFLTVDSSYSLICSKDTEASLCEPWVYDAVYFPRFSDRKPIEEQECSHFKDRTLVIMNLYQSSPGIDVLILIVEGRTIHNALGLNAKYYPRSTAGITQVEDMVHKFKDAVKPTHWLHPLLDRMHFGLVVYGKNTDILTKQILPERTFVMPVETVRGFFGPTITSGGLYRYHVGTDDWKKGHAPGEGPRGDGGAVVDMEVSHG